MSPSTVSNPGKSPASMEAKPLSANGPAAALVECVKFGQKALELVRGAACHEFLDSLLASRLRVDAVRFIAAWLPPRDCLWFGILGVWQVYRLQPQPGHKEVFDQLVAYVTEPSLAGWAGFGPFRNASKDSSPLGLLVQSAILTGDNICPYPKKNIQPDPALVGKTVANALIAAASRWPGGPRNACLDHLIAMGMEIAAGKHLWGPNPAQEYPGLGAPVPDTRFQIGKSRNIWED
jgi:hypothetical protein